MTADVTEASTTTPKDSVAKSCRISSRAKKTPATAPIAPAIANDCSL